MTGTAPFRLRPKGPFRLDLTAWVLRRRPENRVDRWDGKRYERTFAAGRGVFEVSVTQVRFYTIGHSTHPLSIFIRMLKLHEISLVADVRTIPRSRHNPQYNGETLPRELEREGVGYEHMNGLGGLRKVQVSSANRGWRNASFRAYADYMQTGESDGPRLVCGHMSPGMC